MKPFVITIGRGFGSGGKYIGTSLAQRLGVPCYDDDLKRILEEQHGIHQKLFQKMEDGLHFPTLIKVLRKNAITDYEVSPFEGKFTSNANLYKMQCQLLHELANDHSYVVMGKCANHVLKDRENVMSIHVSATMEDCISIVAEKLGATESEAERLVIKTDKYRKDYYKFYTDGRQWDSPLEYDFMLNTSRLGRDTCVEMVLAHINRKFGE